MSLIESYNLTEDGFHPLLIRDSWQVAKLNYSDEYHIDNITCLRKHQNSDKGISLLLGDALLVACNDDQYSDFKVIQMKHGTSYNIPKQLVHAIVMSEGSELFIVENPNTHRDDVTEHDLSEAQREKLRQKVKEVLKKSNINASL